MNFLDLLIGIFDGRSSVAQLSLDMERGVIIIKGLGSLKTT
jgi:hypothetical protein